MRGVDTYLQSDCQLSAAELFWLLPPGSGILYRST